MAVQKLALVVSGSGAGPWGLDPTFGCGLEIGLVGSGGAAGLGGLEPKFGCGLEKGMKRVVVALKFRLSMPPPASSSVSEPRARSVSKR